MSSSTLSDSTLVRHVVPLAPGQEADINAPCCTWARFEVLITITLAPTVAPASGNFDTFRLMYDARTSVKTPSDIVSTGFATVAANLAAGVVTRVDRTFITGIGGIRLRNGFNVRIDNVQVEYRPYSIHTIERER